MLVFKINCKINLKNVFTVARYSYFLSDIALFLSKSISPYMHFSWISSSLFPIEKVEHQYQKPINSFLKSSIQQFKANMIFRFLFELSKIMHINPKNSFGYLIISHIPNCFSRANSLF